MKKTAVILFNLGGPDSPHAVKPFLFNLFNDKAIISLPNPFRFLLAKFISSKRDKEAQKIYSFIGGKSPILELTKKQGEALENELNINGGGKYKSFISMRYWNPLSDKVVKQVKEYAPDEIIFLPLYPQYSTTTSGSSIKDFEQALKKESLSNIARKTICCYADEENFIKSHVEKIKPYYEKAAFHGNPRILFSAHGLPEKIIEKGDPYQVQIEMASHKIANQLSYPALDYVICYQSKVGRLEWIKPSTEDEIIRAAENKIPLVIVPIAFVSEHSETLVELDIEYKDLAKEHGLIAYFRVPALGTDRLFIKSLAEICRNAKLGVNSHCGGEKCDKKHSKCPMKGNV